MARITIQKCINQIPNRFDLVLTAAKRSRQIKAGGTPMVDAENDSPNVIALREIEHRKVDVSVLNEPSVSVEEEREFSDQFKDVAERPAATHETQSKDSGDEAEAEVEANGVEAKADTSDVKTDAVGDGGQDAAEDENQAQ